MDLSARCEASPGLDSWPAGALLSRARPNNVVRCLPGSRALRFQSVVNHFGDSSFTSMGRGRRLLTTASAEPKKCQTKSVGAPLETVSAAGRFLCGILNDHPHIFPIAAAEQLEDLSLDRDNAIARRDQNVGSAESCLHERIAEMMQKECQIAVEEVMYTLVFHRFYTIKVPMVPHLSIFMDGAFELWPSKDKELESIHSDEVLEMVRDHLSNILSLYAMVDASLKQSKTQIKRLQLGRIYAASIMYGYFMKSVSLRHHLEFNFTLTSKDYPLSYLVRMPWTRYVQQKPDQSPATFSCPKDVGASYPTRRPRNFKKLRNYVLGFDSNMLQICAKLKSREATNLIEKHSSALFLDPDGGSFEDGVLAVTHPGMKRLVLEAIAFGTFLWDAERYVDSVYRLEEH